MSGEAGARLSAEVRAVIRLEHQKMEVTSGRGAGGRLMIPNWECEACGQPWPCDAARLLSHLEAVEAQLEAQDRRIATYATNAAESTGIVARQRLELNAAQERERRLVEAVALLKGLLERPMEEPITSDDQCSYCYWCGAEPPPDAGSFDNERIEHHPDCWWLQARAAISEGE